MNCIMTCIVKYECQVQKFNYLVAVGSWCDVLLDQTLHAESLSFPSVTESFQFKHMHILVAQWVERWTCDQ